MILRENNELKIDEWKAPARHLPTALKGTLLDAPNPKLSRFFFPLPPQFLPKEQSSSIASLAVLALIFMAMTFVVLSCTPALHPLRALFCRFIHHRDLV